MPKMIEAPKAALRPFYFHGLQLEEHGNQAIGECVFCGKSNKFSVNVETGQWRCWSCQIGNDNDKGGGGNILTFMRLLSKISEDKTTDYADLVADRKFISWEGLAAWGVSKSYITGEWMAPGYGPDKQIKTLYLYRQDPVSGRYRWLPTPEQGHWLHGGNLWEMSKPEVWLCEGLWDGIALWEVLRQTKLADNGYVLTGSIEASILSQINVLAVQSCGAVGSPLEKVLPFFAGKQVHLLFDSDHTRTGKNGQIVPAAGWEATKRAGNIMTRATIPPKSISYLHWGNDGYDPTKPSGYDLRDLLTNGDRIKNLATVFTMFKPLPGWEHTAATAEEGKLDPNAIQTVACTSWEELEAQWMLALDWRQTLSDVLTVLCAVALSTEQTGDQLFLQLIAGPASAKTRFCDGMLTSTTCYPLEHLTGFHSGWKGDGDDDYSLLSRINNKTLITPEADTMMSNPKTSEIMAQQRRIFDGTSGASYKNRKEDLRWTNLRTPWIMAGTHALLDDNQARVGDRFLRIFIEKPTEEERKRILKKVARTAIKSVKMRSNCKAGSSLHDDMRTAYAMTGGYLDHLRMNAEELLAQVDVDEDWLADTCGAYGEFVAMFRARPHHDHKKESEAVKEEPNRLCAQFVRLAFCIAAHRKTPINDNVMRIVRKVAIDTAHGKTMEIARYLFKKGKEGAYIAELSTQFGQTVEKERSWMRFLKKIGVTEWYNPTKAKHANGAQLKWRLTQKVWELWDEIVVKQGKDAEALLSKAKAKPKVRTKTGSKK